MPTAVYADFDDTVSGATLASMTLAAGFDSDVFWDAGDPTKLTFPADGFYILLAGWKMQPKSPTRQGQFLLNGTDSLAESVEGRGATGGSDTGGNVFYAGSFCQGDYVEFQTRYTASETGWCKGNVVVIRAPDPCFIGSGDRVSAGVVDLIEARDTDDWHSDSTNPDEVVVDATADYLFFAKARTNQDSDLTLNVNGTPFQVATKNSASGTVTGYALLAGIVSLTSGDVVDIEVSASGGTTDAQLVLCKVPDDHAMGKATSAMTVPPYGSGAPKLVAYDDEEVDTNGFHSNVTNNDRMTVPADGTYLILGQLRMPGFAIIDTYLEKNGTEITLTNVQVQSFTSSEYGSCVAFYIDEATTSDYYSQRAFHDSGSTLSTFTNGTRLSILDLADWTYVNDYSCNPFVPQIYRRL